MIKNITESIIVPVSALLGSKIPDEFYMALANDNPDELTELHDSLPQDLKDELARYGCKLPNERVSIKLSLGHLFFSMFINGLKKPVAPLNQKALELKVQKLAIELEKEEFEIPEFAISHIVSNMTSEDLWPSLTLDVVIENGDLKVATQIKAVALEKFRSINMASQEVLIGYLS